jgi:hypothetical protein
LNERKIRRVSGVDVVVRFQVAASKTKIYMVLEFVNGGELFDKIVSNIMDTVLLLHVKLLLLLVSNTFFLLYL